MPPADKDAANRYYAAEIRADAAVHLAGTLLGIVAASTLVALAAASAAATVIGSIVAYSIGLLAMLGFSAAYNLARMPARRERLRRFDHAAIFVMIAGTYTPFTACILGGPEAVSLTAAMWLAALAGVAVKLAYPRRFERASVAIYLGFGWALLIFVHPLLDLLDRSTVTLLVSGGVVYSLGAGVHSWDRLPFHDAIWHGLVVIAAGLHYAAILHAVVLPEMRS